MHFVIFSYAKYFYHTLLSFCDGFRYCFYKTFAMIIFLSLKCFTVFLPMELLLGYSKTFLLEVVGAAQMGKSSTQWEGVVASVNLRTMGRGSNFYHFGAYVLIEWYMKKGRRKKGDMKKKRKESILGTWKWRSDAEKELEIQVGDDVGTIRQLINEIWSSSFVFQ